jgi:acyl carrier protein
MDHNAILHRLTEILRDVLNEDDLVLTPETTADDVPGWDSMTHVNIIVEVERRFRIKFYTAEIDELQSVGDFVDLIARKKAEPAS